MPWSARLAGLRVARSASAVESRSSRDRAETQAPVTIPPTPHPIGTGDAPSVPDPLDPGSAAESAAEPHDPYAALRIRDFRRSLIGHYISGDAERASKWMNPL